MSSDSELIQERLPALALRSQTLVVDEAAAEDRSAPYFLRGRNPELARLTGLIHTMPRSINGIMGPPGSGKSALVSYLAVYAARHGYDVVQLSQEHFESAELVAKRIYPPQLQTTSRTESREGGVDAQILHYDEGTQTTITETMVASMTEAVELRARKADKGLLILIDEFQQLADSGSDKRNNASNFLEFMHSTVPSSNRSRESTIPAACIVAGLLNVMDAAHELGLTRLSVGNCVRLGPITPVNAEQIIRDHVVLHGSDVPPLASVTDSDITRIAELCEGYPRDLTYAGRETQKEARKAQENGHDQLSDQQADRIMDVARAQETKLYQSRLSTTTSSREQYIVLVAADLAEAWDNRIPGTVMRTAITRILSQMDPSSDDDSKLDTKAALRKLRRRGVLEERTPADQFMARDESINTPDAHFCIPIPSFASYIRSQRNQILAEIAEPVPYDDLCQPGALDEQPVTEWQWRDNVTEDEVQYIPVPPPMTPSIRERIKRILNIDD